MRTLSGQVDELVPVDSAVVAGYYDDPSPAKWSCRKNLGRKWAFAIVCPTCWKTIAPVGYESENICKCEVMEDPAQMQAIHGLDGLNLGVNSNVIYRPLDV